MIILVRVIINLHTVHYLVKNQHLLYDHYKFLLVLKGVIVHKVMCILKIQLDINLKEEEINHH